MTTELFSDDWIQKWQARINASSTYRASAAKWEWPLVVRVRPDAAAGLPAGRSIYLDLWHGECREARAATPADIDRATFVMSGDVATWRGLLEGKLDPLAAIMMRKLSLDKGSATSLLGYVNAAKALVAAAAQAQRD